MDIDFSEIKNENAIVYDVKGTLNTNLIDKRL